MKLPLRDIRTSRALALGMAVVCLLGAGDWWTGPEFGFSIFYLLPIIMVSSVGGRWAGYAIAAFSAVAWLTVELAMSISYSHPLVPYWNALVRFGIFLISSALMVEVAERKRVEHELRTSQEELESRVRQRTADLAAANEALQREVAERIEAEGRLKSLNETLEQRVAERSAAAEERSKALARSESALRSQTAILQSILNSMGDGVIVADTRGNILLSNPAAERLLGLQFADCPPDAWLKGLDVFLPNRVRYPVDGDLMLRAIQGAEIDGAEMLVRHIGNGEGVWLAVTGRPLRDERGGVCGGVVVLSDVTSRKILEKQIAEISDREQRRIGQDLHDGLCQHLVSTAFAATVLQGKLADRNLEEADDAGEINDLVNDAITQARSLARGLYPVRLEVDGLAAALDEMASRVRAISGIHCEFTCDEPVLIHDSVAGSNLYRIAQEAVNNAVKHSGARNIAVELGVVEDEVTLTVKDDGAGFQPRGSGGTGMGLHIMNYRARMIGASLEIRPGASGGTMVICSIHNVQPRTPAFNDA